MHLCKFLIALYTLVGGVLTEPTSAAQASAQKNLLPTGALAPFADYMPALRSKPETNPDEYNIITKLQKELLNALKKGNNAQAKNKAQQLENYRANQLNHLYGPATAWLLSHGKHTKKPWSHLSEIDEIDLLVIKEQVLTQAAWLAFFKTEIDAYQAKLINTKKFSNQRIATLVAIYRARLYNDRAKAIAHTACTSHAWHLVEASTVNPGYQEEAPELQALEEKICNTEYPGIKTPINDYYNYWEKKLKTKQTKDAEKAEARIKDKIIHANNCFYHYITTSTKREIEPARQFWSTGTGIHQSAHMTWLIRQYFALQQIPLGSPMIQQIDTFTLPPSICPSLGIAALITKTKAPEISQNLNLLRNSLTNGANVHYWDSIYQLTEQNEPALLRMLLHRTRLTPLPTIQEGTAHHPLCLAISKGNIELVRILSKIPALIDLRDNQGDTPLDLALKINNKPIIAILRSNFAHTTNELGTPDI